MIIFIYIIICHKSTTITTKLNKIITILNRQTDTEKKTKQKKTKIFRDGSGLQSSDMMERNQLFGDSK